MWRPTFARSPGCPILIHAAHTYCRKKASLLIGVGAALPLGRVIRGQLFGVGLFDPITLVVVAMVLGTSAAVASFLPAWRAARLDPGSALREG
jgi:ABC-type antimicrobial peptide transport system permease subunit